MAPRGEMTLSAQSQPQSAVMHGRGEVHGGRTAAAGERRGGGGTGCVR